MSVELEETMYEEDPKGLEELLGKRKDIDPSELGNWALRYAEDNNLKQMMAILRKDPRVKNYENFLKAIKEGDLKRVKQYHRKLTGIIDEDSVNTALLLARNSGFGKIEEFLLEDPRILLQEKVRDNAFPYEIEELLEEDIVIADPGTYDLI